MKRRKTVNIVDFGRGDDAVSVVRYWGAKKIREMMEGGHYIEAFVHAQLNTEQILWDRVVMVFRGTKQMEVRRAIDQKTDQRTRTHELIRWAHI